MENVVFDEDSSLQSMNRYSPAYTGGGGSGDNSGSTAIVRWLIKHNWAKNEGQARGILLAITIVNFLISGFIFYKVLF